MEWAEEEGLCPECYREQRRAEEREAGPAFLARVTSEGLEIVCWRESYPIKDELKARGYRFSEVYGPDHQRNLMRGPGKGWRIQFSEETATADELRWIAGQGYELGSQDAAERLVAAAVEGRPDLIS